MNVTAYDGSYLEREAVGAALQLNCGRQVELVCTEAGDANVLEDEFAHKSELPEVHLHETVQLVAGTAAERLPAFTHIGLSEQYYFNKYCLFEKSAL